MKESYPKRPPRIQLFQDTRPFYFVTFNTFRRQHILDSTELHQVFLQFCLHAHEEFGVSVGRYVIMPDHIHLFVALPDSGIRLQSWIKSLKSVLGKTLVEFGHSKPHWQEGFFDHVMRSSDSYGEKWRYVEQNPVRAGLCLESVVWPYSGEIVRLSF